jgi:hypothetical protein
VGHVHHPAGAHRGLADEEHAAGVAVVAVLDDGDVDIEDVAVLEPPVTGDAVADLVIDGGADGAGEALVVQRRRDGLLLVDDVVVAEAVQFLGGDARLHVGGDHFQDLGRQAPGHAHFLDLFCGLDGHGHGMGLGSKSGLE